MLLLFFSLTLLSVLYLVEAMVLPSGIRLLVCTLLSSVWLSPLISAQCPNATTAINGKAFPALIDATTEDLITGLESGLFTSVDLVNAYTARIMEVNATLHMVTELNPDALLIAAEADGLRANGTVLGPLHGIPILIKNNIATADKMDNTAGSWSLAGAKLPRDSTIASKLRKAGAIILGKTNLSQWANYRSFNTSNGWSAFGGQTKGAYYPDQDPSGSSSGSGVASSLGLALSALGTETSGSILSPSDANNLVGIKPSVGLTSRDLVIPISSHQDTVGPMARTVKDAAYLLSAIAGYSPYDNYTSAIPFDTIPDYVAACRFDGLKGKRIGIPRNVISGRASPNPVIDTFDSIIPILRSAGAIIIDNANWTGYAELSNSSYGDVVLEADFITDLPESYLSNLIRNPNNINSVPQLLNFTHSFPLEDWPERDTEIWEDALSLGYDNTSPEFWGNYTAQLYLAGPLGVTGALTNYSLDALILPTDYSPGVPAIIGTPVITVPLGKLPEDTPVRKNRFGNLNATYPGAPFGLSFMGPKWSEEMLVGMAYAFEQRTQVRDTITPYVQPVTELVDVVNKRKMMA
jgi:amidase